MQDFSRLDLRNSKLKMITIFAENLTASIEALQQAPNLERVFIFGLKLPFGCRPANFGSDKMIRAIVVKDSTGFEEQIRNDLVQDGGWTCAQLDMCPPGWLLFKGITSIPLSERPKLMPTKDNCEEHFLSFLEGHINLGTGLFP